MQDLIARLEKATGPDRRLDLAIFCAMDEFRVPFREYFMAWVSHDKGKTAPLYTASVDAALTLVPPDGEQEVQLQIRPEHTNAMVLRDTFTEEGSAVACSAHPAIAICIAALKARAAAADQ